MILKGKTRKICVPILAPQ